MTKPDNIVQPNFVVSLREARMVIERLIQWQGFSAGRRPELTNAALYSVSLGLSKFSSILETLTQLKVGIENRSVVSGPDNELQLDALGKHSWAVAEEVSDLLTDLGRRLGCGRISIINICCPEEIGVVAAIIEKHGFTAKAQTTGPNTASVDLKERVAFHQTELARIGRAGIPVDRKLWYELFHASNNAQAPDTKQSRMHTGSVVLTEDGQLVGEQDDEYLDMDVSLLEKDLIEEPEFIEGQE